MLCTMLPSFRVAFKALLGRLIYHECSCVTMAPALNKARPLSKWLLRLPPHVARFAKIKQQECDGGGGGGGALQAGGS